MSEDSRRGSANVKRFRENLQDETNGVYLYEQLAAIEEEEKNPQLAGIYRGMAEMERRHAEVWAARLREAGEDVDGLRPGWRTRTIIWLARRVGVNFVLPFMVRLERGAEAAYAVQPEAVAAGLPADERSHAETLRDVARATGGMGGNVIAFLEGRHRAVGGNALRAGVLGSNDGLVSNLSLVMGVAGADLSANAILIAGVAGLLAGSISMALGEWISVQSSRELYKNQLRIEREELMADPGEERQELVLIYQAKGMTREEAERTADRIMQDPEVALDTLAREELGIDPGELGGSAWVAAGTSFILFALGAIFPVLPYFFTEGARAIAFSVGLSAAGLFVLGAAITLLTGRGLLYSGARQVLFGLAAAVVTFSIGRAIGVAIAG